MDDQKQENNQDVKGCCEELKQIKEKYLYCVAEFDNFKKRTDKEKPQWIAQGQISVINDLLPIIDDFKRTFAAIEKQHASQEVSTYIQGLQIIFKSFEKFLKKNHIEEIEATQFDPELHEAIAQVEVSSKQTGDIVEVFESGYKFRDQVLRPAKVSVAK